MGEVLTVRLGFRELAVSRAECKLSGFARLGSKVTASAQGGTKASEVWARRHELDFT